MVKYQLLAKNFSLRYTKNGPVDLYVVGNDYKFSTHKIPVVVMFKKKKEKTYLLLITPIQPNEYLPADLIDSVIK